MTSGGTPIIPNVHVKSHAPLGTQGFEGVPLTRVWFSNHLVSVGPESKPCEKVWTFQPQLKVGSTDICEVICKRREAERAGEGGCIDAVDRHTLSPHVPSFPFLIEMGCLTSPALPFPTKHRLSFLHHPVTFPHLPTTTPTGYISMQISVITQTIRRLKLDRCPTKVMFCCYL